MYYNGKFNRGNWRKQRQGIQPSIDAINQDFYGKNGPFHDRRGKKWCWKLPAYMQGLFGRSNLLLGWQCGRVLGLFGWQRLAENTIVVYTSAPRVLLRREGDTWYGSTKRFIYDESFKTRGIALIVGPEVELSRNHWGRESVQNLWILPRRFWSAQIGGS